MKRRFRVTLLTLGVVFSSFQSHHRHLNAQALSATPRQATAEIFDSGPDVSAPQLIPSTAPTVEGRGCDGKERGTVTLLVVIDESGNPSEAYFLRPLGTNLDRLAVLVATADHFNPGVRKNTPVAVRQKLEISLEGCVVDYTDNSGKASKVMRLRSQPTQTLHRVSESDLKPPKVLRVGTGPNGVTAPIPILTGRPLPPVYDKLKNRLVTGATRVVLTVDSHGLPENAYVAQSLDPEFDQKALESVDFYRFRPAMKNGMPFPAKMNIEVNTTVR